MPFDGLPVSILEPRIPNTTIGLLDAVLISQACERIARGETLAPDAAAILADADLPDDPDDVSNRDDSDWDAIVAAEPVYTHRPWQWHSERLYRVPSAPAWLDRAFAVRRAGQASPVASPDDAETAWIVAREARIDRMIAAAQQGTDMATILALSPPAPEAPKPSSEPDSRNDAEVDQRGIEAHASRVAEYTRQDWRAVRQNEDGGPFPADLLQVDGLLGQFITECERSAPERRQPVYALATGICLVGALAGRRYRSETDLRTNVYAAILGKSSSGKGHAIKVASQLLHQADLARYVAADYASGNAIMSELVAHPARLAIVDEFGIWLASLTGERAPKHLVDIRKRLMTLFSSANDTVSGVGYANTAERQRRDIRQPHLCFLGVGTPEHVFEALQSGALKDGFLPRFLMFQPDEYYPPLVETPQPIEVSAAMIQVAQRIAGAAPEQGNLAAAVAMQSDVEWPATLVPFTPDGRAEHERWRRHREATIQGGCAGFHSDELLGKWGEHAVKLAMIRAISSNPETPVMRAECASWGWRLSEWCIRVVNGMARRHLADNKVEAAHKRVLNLITDAGPDGLLHRDLLQRTRFLAPRDRAQIIAALTEGGDISAEPTAPVGRGGRPGVRYRAA